MKIIKIIALSALALSISSGHISASGTNDGKYINNSTPSSAQSSKPKLTRVQIKLVQSALADLGHRPGAIDGSYGSATKRAIRRYQASIGASQTGALTRRTACRLLKKGVANHGSGSKLPSWC